MATLSFTFIDSLHINYTKLFIIKGQKSMLALEYP